MSGSRAVVEEGEGSGGVRWKGSLRGTGRFGGVKSIILIVVMASSDLRASGRLSW